MKKSKLIILTVPILFVGLLAAGAEAASPCTDALIRAMKDEGLSASQIKSVCERANAYEQKKSSVFTPRKVEQDLVGMAMGPQAGVIVETGRGRSPGAAPQSRSPRPGGRSYDALVSIPMGIVFDETNIRRIQVLDTGIKGGTARVVAHVETVSGYAGKLRLSYELIAGQWTLLEVENLDFRQQ